MDTVDQLFRVEFEVSSDHVEIFSSVLESQCESVTWILSECGAKAKVTGFSTKFLNKETVSRAILVASEFHNVFLPRIDVSQISPKNWILEHTKQVSSLMVGRYFIHGSDFIGKNPISKISMYIPANEAFGTGHHGSTQGCLLALDGLKVPYIQSALDMGCGSGILALAIAKRWRCRVLAADLDSKAINITKQNVVSNGERRFISVLKTSGYSYRFLRARRFNIVVSNILARPLVKMSYSLSKILAPRGFAVLSGFLNSQENHVLAAHRALGLKLNRRITIDGWTTLVLSKNA